MRLYVVNSVIGTHCQCDIFSNQGNVAEEEILKILAAKGGDGGLIVMTA